MEITRYQIKQPELRPWVKFIWVIRLPDQELENKLLPTDSIDLLLNAGAPMICSIAGQQITAPAIHINGLRNEHGYIRQADESGSGQRRSDSSSQLTGVLSGHSLLSGFTVSAGQSENNGTI